VVIRINGSKDTQYAHQFPRVSPLEDVGGRRDPSSSIEITRFASDFQIKATLVSAQVVVAEREIVHVWHLTLVILLAD
jgi:hypothetical protein